jgi:hypothetical protein
MSIDAQLHALAGEGVIIFSGKMTLMAELVDSDTDYFSAVVVSKIGAKGLNAAVVSFKDDDVESIEGNKITLKPTN